MKRFFLFLSLLAIGMELSKIASQNTQIYDVRMIMENIATQIEKGEFISTAKLEELNHSLSQYTFKPLAENHVNRIDKNIPDTCDIFLYLPEYIDSLMKNGETREFAQKMYSKFIAKGSKGSQSTANFLLNTYTLLADSTAIIRIYTQGEQGILVIAQPFAKINVTFFDNEKNISGIDLNKNKGERSYIHHFKERGRHLIELQVKNKNHYDISFTIIAD